MFDWLEGIIWKHFGLKWSEPYAHHICTRCNKIFFCVQSGIDMPKCKVTDSGGHEDYEVYCNCRITDETKSDHHE